MSSRSSMYRRLMTMAGATALTVGGLGAVLATGGTAFASGTASSSYSIGYTVSGVTFASTSSVSAASANYTLGFVMPSNVNTSSTTLTLSDLPGTYPSSETAIVTDTTAGTTQVLAINSSGVITLSGAVAGDNYTIVLDGATNATVTSSTSYSPEIMVGSSDIGTAASFTLTPTSTAAAATASASTSTSGASATDTFSGFAVTTNGTGTTSTNDLYLDFSAASQTYPTAPSDYAVQVTSNGHTTSDTVDSVTGLATGSTSGEYLTLTLASAIPTSATVAVTIDGAINSTSPTSSSGTYVSMSDSTDGGSAPSTAPSAPASSTDSDDATFLSTVNLPATLVVNPDSSSATAATWSTSFTVPSGYSYTSGDHDGVIDVTAPAGFTATNGWAVFDATHPSADSSGTGSSPTFSSGVQAGDSVTVDYYGVSNPSATSASATFTLASGTTPTDYTFSTQSVSLTTVPTSPVNVMVSPTTPGAAATYTISGLSASSAIAAGADTIVLRFPTGTVLPTAASNYTLTDLTNSSGSGVSNVSVSTYTPSSGTANDTVELKITNTNAIAAGDNLQLTVTGAINPTDASTSYYLDYAGLTAATEQVVATVPTAAMTYPNGALIQSGGQIDVVAGGYAFGIPTPAVLNKIMMMDHSGVFKGSFPTATMPAPGTLINPVGTSGYWVVGTNGEIYQFSSMSQFMQEGYVASQVIPVPNAGGLTAGAGAPPKASTTMANGALVQFGSTIYEYAGGVPTGIQTPAQLASIQKMTGAMVVMGSGSTPTAAKTSANGTLVQPLGKAGIWVSDGGTLYQFMSASQFTNDGYSFQYVLPIATLGTYTPSSI